jgi:hypothetical protein
MAQAPHVTPEKIMQIATGAWATGILAAAVQHRVFTLLEEKPSTTDELAQRARVSPRGAQALLDALVGLGLARLEGGRYANAPDSSQFLVEGKPSYMGGFLKCEVRDMKPWMQLAEIVKSGAPATGEEGTSAAFFEELVPAIAPLSFPVAEIAAKELGLAQAGAISVLDVGGGSGVFNAVWLKANPRATATQLDFPGVNAVARAYVGRFGVGDRFRTVDGDFHTTDFGTAAHDVVVYSHIAHMESPEQNTQNFRRFHAVLKPGGMLVVNDFVLEDDRSGPPFPLIFHANMLVRTEQGGVYRAEEYRSWLRTAGFSEVRFVKTPTPATLIFAKK